MQNETSMMQKYLNLLVKLRVFIVAGISILTIFLFFNMNKPLLHDDVKLWLDGSQEYNRILHERHPKSIITQLRMPYEDSVEDIKILQNLHSSLQENPAILQVVSPFSHLKPNMLEDGEDSHMLSISTLLDASSKDAKAYIDANSEYFKFFLEDEKISFFIVSKEMLHLKNIPAKAELIHSNITTGFYDDLMLIGILLAIVFILFAIAFKTTLSSLMALLFIIPTTVITVSLFTYISPNAYAHVSILLIALTVSLMDFIYIYYKWHLFQKKHAPLEALLRAFATTLRPIFWTSVISVFGLGTLVFADSLILNSIGLNIILSSLSGFVLSFTWLLALLSFTKTKNPFSVTEKSSHYFAIKEVHFHSTLLNVFLVTTALTFIYNVYDFYTKPVTIATNEKSKIVKLALKTDELKNADLVYLEKLHSEIGCEFGSAIRTKSIYSEIEKIAKAEHLPFNALTSDLDHFTFMLDLYGGSPNMINDGFTSIEIFLQKDSAQKSKIIQWLRNFDNGDRLLITDTDSLLNAAKFDSINVMFYVVAFVILLITLIVWVMTGDLRFVVIAIIVNITPISWFFLFVKLLDVALSTEILVAMIIAVALASDATIHFIHHYHFHRKKNHTAQMALERSFLYVGTPLGLGNSILGLVFLLMMLVSIDTVALIGLYSAILVGLSLLTDLFVLPVLFVKMILHEKGHV